MENYLYLFLVFSSLETNDKLKHFLYLKYVGNHFLVSIGNYLWLYIMLFNLVLVLENISNERETDNNKKKKQENPIFVFS
jgi:hypothetical protein